MSYEEPPLRRIHYRRFKFQRVYGCLWVFMGVMGRYRCMGVYRCIYRCLWESLPLSLSLFLLFFELYCVLFRVVKN